MSFKRNIFISFFVLSFSSNAFALTAADVLDKLYKYCMPSVQADALTEEEQKKYLPVYNGKTSVATDGSTALCGCNNSEYSFLYYPTSYTGTDGNTVDNKAVRLCTECPMGYIADTNNVTKCKEIRCPAGFYGALISGPTGCPAGFYAHMPIAPCPAGTYKWNY